MVEFVKVVLIETTRMANIGAVQDNNIIISEVEVLDI